MKLDELKHGFGSLLDTLGDGWHRLRETAAGAFTHFRPGQDTDLPARGEVDDDFYLPTQGWAMLGGDVFEDDKRVVVRLEIPGMDKKDLDIEVQADVLVVRGEKRFEREGTRGRYRVLQCAYGDFQRVVSLPAPVMDEGASARYRDGVLRVELPKMKENAPGGRTIKVE